MDDIFSRFPVLTTERLSLVEIVDEHAGDIYNTFSNEAVTRYYNVETMTCPDDAIQVVNWFKLKYADKKGIRWGIRLRGTTSLIGTIGINTFVWGQRGTIGYELAFEQWGRGYVAEAISAVVAFAFEEFGLNRIEAEVMVGNTASEKVLLKSGFVYEGTLRQSMFWLGKWHDMKMFSLLRDDMAVSRP